jgi:hemolysin activation/secretion protein
MAVEEQPRFSVGVGTDNHRATSTGADTYNAFFSARDLTGYGEQINGSSGKSQGTNIGSASLSVPVSARNSSFQIYYSRSVADIIDARFEALDIASHFEIRGVSFTHPLIKTIADRFSVVLGFESNRSTTYLLGEPFSFSPGAENGGAATTVGIVGLDWVDHGQSNVSALRITYRHGFDALNATIYNPNAPSAALENPTGADGRFGLVRGRFSFIQRLNAAPGLGWLNDRAQVVLRGTAQLALDPLMTLEKLAIGGVNTVRGYAENLLVRDNGVAGTLEFQLRGAGLGLLAQPFKGLDAEMYGGRGRANNFQQDDPRKFRPDDLQERSIHYAVTYVYRW